MYDSIANDFKFLIGGTARMKLSSSTLTVNGSAVSSDKISKFNQKKKG